MLGEYTVHYTYDVLDRVTCEKAVHEDGTEYYTYYTYLTVGDNTTSFVSAVTYKTKAVGATAETTVGSVHYTYDRNGFISSVTYKNALGAVTATESYTYDALGQLKTVTNGNNVTEYTYDTAGNILSKTVNGTVVGSYTYGDTQWKDLLTSYNGQTITYDAIGNPTTYIGWSNLTWSMGRKLTALSNSTDSISYTYNANGQRISKTVNGVTTEFCYDDRGSLILLTNDDHTLYFYPDADGSIGSFKYNNEQYYYVRNAQNDVIGITDSTGNFVAKYTYDEWGVITSITDGNGVDVSANSTHIANLNPFRYRSYFYDAETGFYWLNTRYYDPAIGRFINADSYASTGQGIIGHNMFAYCGNNPINRVEIEGFFWKELKEFGKNCLKAAVVVGSIGMAAGSIVAAVAFTGATGGAGAAAIPVAATIAVESLALATTVVAGIGVASVVVSDAASGSDLPIGYNGTQTPSKRIRKGKKGSQRLEVENPDPGNVNRKGQIHYHDENNNKYMLNFETREFEGLSNREFTNLIKDPKFVKALKYGFEILGETF